MEEGARDIQKMSPSVKVYIGYGWGKFDAKDKERLHGHEILADQFWQSLKDKFDRKQISVPSYQDKIRVSCNRLRGIHGKEIWATVRDRIAKADVLIFDVAAAINPKLLVDIYDGDDITGKITSFNSNVLIEIGVALGMGKRVLLLCPKNLFKKIPSDLQGYLWSVYSIKYENDVFVRRFADEYGINAAFGSMLRSAAIDKLVKDGFIKKGEENDED